MTITVTSYGTGFGITDPSTGTYRWNGHSFNPTAKTASGYQSWDVFTYTAVSLPVLYNSTSTISLSGFYYGNEAVLQLLTFETSVEDNGTITLRFKDPDGNIQWSATNNWYLPAAGWWWYQWLAMGVKAGGAEIWKDGVYTVEYDIYSAIYGHYTGSTTFTVSNYPTATYSYYRGSIWVEGEYLCFICYQYYKVRVLHDGSSSYVDTAYAGSIWLEEDGRITYIDASGYKRKTKLGDKYGYDGWTAEIPAEPGDDYAGSIWVSSANEGDTYLMIVSEDGIKYRIGAGYALSGDYQ